MQVIERPDIYQQGRRLGLKSIFSEVTTENEAPLLKTKPPSAAAAQVIHPARPKLLAVWLLSFVQSLRDPT